MRDTLLALTTPATILTLVMGSLWAGAFHCLTVTKGSRLLVTWTIGVAGFAIGVLLARFLGLHLISIGPIDVLIPSIVSIALMIVARLVKL